jgi:cell division protein FtsQ
MGVDTLERTEPAAPIDPRIRARRIAVRRDQARRRLHHLAELGAVVAVALAFLVALRTPLLDVDEVVVAGADRTGAEVVLAAAGIEVGEQLVDVDLAGAAARVGELPWVAEVSVRRSLGGTVSVEVVERRPVALVRGGGPALLVDPDGAVLATVDEAPQLGDGLVAVAGAPAGLRPGQALPDELAEALVAAERLAEAVPGAVEDVRADGELVATLVQGGEVRLGDTRQLDAKLLTLATVLAEVDLDGLGVLDLRLPGNPVLTRAEP